VKTFGSKKWKKAGRPLDLINEAIFYRVQVALYYSPIFLKNCNNTDKGWQNDSKYAR
jgi:hypothetical protein